MLLTRIDEGLKMSVGKKKRDNSDCKHSLLTNKGVATVMCIRCLSESVVPPRGYLYGGKYENFHACGGINDYVITTAFRYNLL